MTYQEITDYLLNTQNDLLRGTIIEMAYQYYSESSTPTSKMEDCVSHIDFSSDTETVDVKAPKKDFKANDKFNGKWTLVELRNVAGNTGWLKGKADYIVFCVPLYDKSWWFIKVPRKELLDYVIKEYGEPPSVVDTEVKGCEPELWHYYRREGRDDAFIYLDIIEVMMNVRCIRIPAEEYLTKAIEVDKELNKQIKEAHKSMRENKNL